MKEQIQELYEHGLEKFAGDHTKAQEFVEGFLKEASGAPVLTFAQNLQKGLGSGLGQAAGAGLMGIGLGLGIHGLSSAFQHANTGFLKEKFEAALSSAIRTNPILVDADPHKVRSYAETVFKFAPHVATDPNLLSSILANAVHGEGLDPMTIRTLADLEGRVQESRKNSLFSPKAYT